MLVGRIVSTHAFGTIFLRRGLLRCSMEAIFRCDPASEFPARLPTPTCSWKTFMAQTAKPEADKAVNTAKEATDNVADLGKRTADKAADVTRETVDKAEDLARGGLRTVERTVGAAREVERAVTQRSAEGTAELGQVLTGLFKEQAQHNVETLSAFAGAVDWQQVARAVDWKQVTQIQTDYLRVSMERLAHLTQRYLEINQAVLATATSAALRQANKAA